MFSRPPFVAPSLIVFFSRPVILRNGALSTQEAASALLAANVDIPPPVLNGGVVWAHPAEGPWSTWQQVVGSADIKTMVEEAVNVFVATGTFYGYYDGISPSIYDMDATYPNSDWTKDECEKGLNAGAVLTWSLNPGDSSLYRQCGYVNGAALDSSVFVDELAGADTTASSNLCYANGKDGTTCTLKDPAGIAEGNRKRLYCVWSSSCPAGAGCSASTIDPKMNRLMCRTGLLYDGRPADLTPRYSTREGVKFQWLVLLSSTLNLRSTTASMNRS